MPRFSVVRDCQVQRTPRVMQVEGMFDVPPSGRSEERWEGEFDLPQDWNIGLIVGPSGCGKSTLARELFGDHLVTGWEWPADKSLLDGFPKDIGIKDLTGLLSSVGFSSPPLWLRPFGVLSTGEQFRVNVARTLSEKPDLAVIDEFTSVVDRTVAQIGCAAVAKTVRRRGQNLIAVSCHYDIIDWLEPDWVYQPHLGQMEVNTSPQRGRLWQRPPVELEVCRVHRKAWELFRQYHYLSHTFNKAARCFVAFYRGEPVALQAVLSLAHSMSRVQKVFRGHRAVCLPDYQGIGIGSALSDYIASAYRGIGARFYSTTTHPSLVQRRIRSPHWRCRRAPSLAKPRNLDAPERFRKWTPAIMRLTSSWEYVGPAMEPELARALITGVSSSV